MNNTARFQTSINDILRRIKYLRPNSAAEMVDGIKNQLQSSMVEIFNQHNTNSVVFIFKLEKRCVLKAEFGEKENSVEKEIKWYINVGQKLSYVPQYVSSIKTHYFCALVIKYIENSLTLDEVSLNLTHDIRCSSGFILEFVDTTLNKLNEIFYRFPSKQLSISRANRFILEKYKDRKSQSVKHGFLKELFLLDKIYINGEEFPNYDYYISEIESESKLVNYLTPRQFGIIHGDLHCGNILIDRNLNSYLIDPNGSFSLPIEYDYGKLFHSIHGGYGSIKAGKYQLERKGFGRYEFSVYIPDSYVLTFDQLKNRLNGDLLVRGTYLEALHFATMLPHHAQDKDESTALFLRGLILFRELFNFLH